MQDISILPGRVRLKSKKLYRNKSLAKYLNTYIDNLYGVKYSSVNHSTAAILIVFDPQKIGLDLLKQNINKAVASVIKNKPEKLSFYDRYYKTIEKRDRAKRNLIVFGLIYIAFKIKNSFYGKFSISSNVKVLQVASAITIIGGYPLIKSLYKRFAKNIPTDSDILLNLIALSFTLMRESSKGVFVLMLKEMNDYIKYSAEAEGERLMNQRMKNTSGMAWLNRSPNEEILIPLEKLKIGDTIAVHSGELVPVYGEVLEGSAVVNSLYFTGQPLINNINQGNVVHEGLSLIAGELKVRVGKIPDISDKPDITKDGLDIYKRVKSYQDIITPVSFGAGAMALLFTGNILNALSVLLVLTPAAAATALSSGQKSYIALLNKHKTYLRNPNTIEELTKTTHIVFDKTGTLTYGIMKIESVISYDKNYSERDILMISAACEVDSYHPISVTLQKETAGKIDMNKVKSSVLLPSKGIIASYENHIVAIGNKNLMDENNIDIKNEIAAYLDYEQRLFTPVFVSIDNKISGIIVMKDTIRKDSFEMIKRLKQKGIRNISILTGDNQKRAAALAKELGISNVYSNCSCEEKEKVIQSLKSQETVIMVGDGINDINAMRSADVSISFINSSVDKVKLHSDCIIFDDNLTRLADIIPLSRKAYKSINISITISQIYNLVWGGLACFGSIDAFAAKSINTINSLIVMLINKKIEYLKADRYSIRK